MAENVVVYEKGRVFAPLRKASSEGVVVELTPHGLDIVVMYASPTEEEMEQFEYAKPFELREAVIYGNVIYFAMKIGNLPWHDAPFSPHLVAEMPDITEFSEGMPVTMFIMDLETKVIASQVRQMMLSVDFSKKLCKDIAELHAKEFSREQYNECVDAAQARYSSVAIARMAENRCVVNGKRLM